jgi:hypothetical protein
VHCGDHRFHKARTQPIHLSGPPRHTEYPEPQQLVGGIVIEPTDLDLFVTKELTIATLADSGFEMALHVGAATDFVLTGV